MNEHYYTVLAGGELTAIADIPTLTVHANYAANDYVGTSGVAMEFLNCAKVDGGGGAITGVILLDAAVQSVACEVWLFDSDPTPPNDSAAWTITDANLLRLIGIVPISTYYASAVNSVGQNLDATIPFKCASGSKALYGCIVTRGAPTYASGDLTVILKVLRA